jgi:predicted peptidase
MRSRLFVLALLLSCAQHVTQPETPSSNPVQPPMPRVVQLEDPPVSKPEAPVEGSTNKKNNTSKKALTAKQIRAVKTSDFKALTFESQQTDLSMPYRLFVPKGYDPSRKYALILYMHGAGDRGSDNEKQFSQLTMWMARSKEQVETPAFILAPQCPSRMQWVNTPWKQGSYSVDNTPMSDPMKVVLEILASVQAEYNIDPDRILLTGVSMGGFAVLDLTARFPERFAAVVSVCGAGDPSKAASFAHVPMWLFHGERDRTVPTRSSREMVAALKAAGASPIYVEYEDQEHGIWNTAYKDDEMMKWFFSQTRQKR